MLFKNRLVVGLLAFVLFVCFSSPAHANISSLKNGFNKNSGALIIGYGNPGFFDNSKSDNTDTQKLKRKPLNKKLYRKIKRFLKKKKIRRKRRIVAEVFHLNHA